MAAVKDLLVRALTGHTDATRAAPPERTALEAPALRRWIAPVLLVATCPVLVAVLWMVCAPYDGSVLRFAREIDGATFVRLLPRPSLEALGMLAGWVSFQWLLLRFLPGGKHIGPITPAGCRPTFRSNGVAAWSVTHGALGASYAAGLWSATSVYERFGSMLMTLNVLALLFCVLLYVKGRRYPSTPDAVYTGKLAYDFFHGIELHPALFGVSLKQLVNCRVSMMGWSVLLLCFTGHQLERDGSAASSLLVSTGLVVAYLFKFFWWEGGYFASLDIMHDRFGYYICWGVLVWVPSVYTIFGQYLVRHPRELPAPVALGLGGVGLAALLVNYAADAQRQLVRRTNGKTAIWGKPARTLVAHYRTADGEARANLLLVSGYWGWARHFHYVPELALALCWSLPAGFDHIAPYFYVAFLALLLVDRAGHDDRRCQVKYGAAWDEYRRLVPYKILPGVY